MRLKDVPKLRFLAGAYALNTRDYDLIPQLQCAYNPLNDPSVEPIDVTCYNRGVDSTGQIVWQCDGITHKAVEFDNLQISCEGYNFPGDELVKEGSCALKYTLRVAQPQNQNQDNTYHNHQPRQHYRTEEAEGASGWSFSTVLIFVLIVVLVIRCARKKRNTTPKPVVDNTDNTEPCYNTYQEPSAPPCTEDEESVYTKRTGFANTVSR